jgi:hypothetical protein
MREVRMNPSSESSAIAVVNLREFFHDSVQQALKHQHVAVEDQTEHYVVNVLTTFARSEALYDSTNEGAGLPPLVNMLAAALDAPTVDQRNQLLQRLGDVSLFVAGFFAHSFARRLVDVDYHIAMGGRAYGSLADSMRGMRGRAVAAVYAELASKFQRMVDVLNDVAEMARPASDKDVLRLYEIWLKTGSPRARRLLSQLGVSPVAVSARA